MVSSAPPVPPDFLDLAKRERKATCEVLSMREGGGGHKMVQALQRSYVFVDAVQVCWMMQGDPHYAFLPAGTNDEIEITLVPRDEGAVAQDEDVWLQTGFAKEVEVKVWTAVLLRNMLFVIGLKKTEEV